MTLIEGKKAAVIGLGNMGLRHISSYQNLGAVVIAAADIREEARKLAKKQLAHLRVYENWRELLEKEKFEILSVATNGPSHAEIVIAAANKKIPTILCEKPMATNVTDANKMIGACKKSGSELYINLTLRIFPEFEKLLHLLRSGEIGDIRSIFVSMAGRRGLGCNATHYLDLMRMILKSDAVRVWGRIDKTGTPNVRGPHFRDPGGYGIYEFANGARGFIEMSEDLTHEPLLIIIGSKGKALLDMADHGWDNKAPKRWEIHKIGTESASTDMKLAPVPFDIGKPVDLVTGTTLTLADIANNGRKIATGEDGKKALEMVMALHVSDLRGGRVTNLPLAGSDLNYDVPMT